MDQFTEWELGFNLFLQENFRATELSSFFKVFTSLNNAGVLAISVILLLLVTKEYRAIARVAGLSLSLEFILNNLILKPMVARPRPYEFSDEVVLLIKKAMDFSFPSGHTGSAFAIAVVLLFFMPKKYGIFAVSLSTLMGFSRLYVGIHYPSDVLFGALLGTSTALFSVWFFKKYRCPSVREE